MESSCRSGFQQCLDPDFDIEMPSLACKCHFNTSKTLEEAICFALWFCTNKQKVKYMAGGEMKEMEASAGAFGDSPAPLQIARLLIWPPRLANQGLSLLTPK